jgi:hypothetical protein
MVTQVLLERLVMKFLSTWFPYIDNTYSAYGLLLLTLIFFIFSADLNIKK